LEHETPALTQGDQLVHQGGISHRVRARVRVRRDQPEKIRAHEGSKEARQKQQNSASWQSGGSPNSRSM
jgi:hypothetical protein